MDTHRYSIKRQVSFTQNGNKGYEFYDSNGNQLLEYIPGVRHQESIYIGNKRVAQQIMGGAGTVISLHSDISGSPLLATDASGNVLWKENYRPFGERQKNASSSWQNQIWFANKPYDATTGLSYMGARYYNPMIGRFMGVDPKGFNENSIYSFNRYAYANNNPYKFVDPDGHSPIDIVFLAYDLGKLGFAIYSGNPAAIMHASGDVALSVVGVASPWVGTGEVLKTLRGAEHIAEVARGAEVAREAEKTVEISKSLKYTPGGKFSKTTKQEAAERAGQKCEYCGIETTPAVKSQRGVTPPKNEAQTDHIIPSSKGGTNAPENAAHSCRDCNRKFSDQIKPNPRND